MIPTRYDAFQLFMQGIQALAHAEQNGLRVDVPYLERTKQRLTRKIEKLTSEFATSKFYKHWEHVFQNKTNLDSPQQLSHLLYKVRKIEIKKKTTGDQGAVDEEVLLNLGIPELVTYVERKKLKKLRDTYLEAYIREQVDGFIHPFFNLHTVKSFRSSADHPNPQNVPKRDEESMYIVRRGLFPRLGHQLGEADFKGTEVAANACLNKDPNLLRYVRDPSTDMHRDMAIQIFKLKEFKKLDGYKQLRQAAKNGFVFPEFYGDYYGSCAENIACGWCKLPKSKWKNGQGIEIEPGLTVADQLISVGIKSYDTFTDHLHDIEEDFWGNRFKVYQQWKDDWWEAYQRNGYIDLPTGFRCSGVMNKKEVCNYPGQGVGFHWLLWCFIELDKIAREEKWDSRLIGQIHDSILLDINPAERDHVYKTLKRVAEVELPKHWPWIIVPIVIEFEMCEVDQPWSEKREFSLAA